MRLYPSMDLKLQSEDSDYERFSSSMTDARRRKAERAAPAPTVDVVVGQLSNSVQLQKDNQRGESVNPLWLLICNAAHRLHDDGQIGYMASWHLVPSRVLNKFYGHNQSAVY